MSQNSTNVPEEAPSSGYNTDITQPSVATFDGSPPSDRSQQRRGRQQNSGDQLNRVQGIRRNTASSDSHEIRWSRHVTRDSMISGMLQSLNSQGSQTNHSPSNSVKRSNDFPPSSFPRAIAALNSHHSNSPSTTSAESYPSPAEDDRQRPSPRKLGRPKTANRFCADSSQSSAESSGSSNPQRYKQTSRSEDPSSRTLSVMATSSTDSNPRSSEAPSGHSAIQNGSAFDFNPRSHFRKRSRSEVQRGSVLDRARPVPPEYHTFGQVDHDQNGNSIQKAQTNSVSGQIPRTKSEPNALASSGAGGPDARTSSAQPLHASRYAGLPGPETVWDAARSSTRQGPDSIGGRSYPMVTNTALPEIDHSMKAQQHPLLEKERPGFFKRMFSNTKTRSGQSDQAPQLPPLEVVSKREAKGDVSSGEPAHQDSSPASKKQPERTLNKKSSFWRRRRKTLTEAPPPIPAQEPSTAASHAQTSQVPQGTRPSSLQNAMDPFLADAQKNAEKFFDTVEQQPHYQGSSKNSPSTTVVASFEPVSDKKPSITSNTPVEARAEPMAESGGMAKDLPLESPTIRVAQDTRTIPPGERSPINPNRPSRAFPTGYTVDLKTQDPQRRKASLAPQDAETASRASSIPDSTTSTPNATLAPAKDPRTEDLLLGKERSKGDSRSPSRVNISSTSSTSDRADFTSPSKLELTDQPPTLGSRTISAPPNVEVPAQGIPKSPGSDSQMNENENPLEVQQRARNIFEGPNDDQGKNSQVATELGRKGPLGDRLRSEYMEFFDFTGLNILLALRDLCARLPLKGESQEVDRILGSFSNRWCQSNPNHGFKSQGRRFESCKLGTRADHQTDVVHAICYSLLLLNTDLHVADVQKMTRNEFIKNTLPTIRSVAEEEVPNDPNTTIKPERMLVQPGIPFADPRSPSPISSHDRPSADLSVSDPRLSNSKNSLRPTSDVPSFASPTPYDNRGLDASEMLVNAPHDGNVKGWEKAIETILKEFYLSIRQLRLPLHGASEVRTQDQPSTNSLSVMNNIMRRTGSVISKTPSDTSRGRPSDLRSAAARWTSKNRSRPKLYPGSTFGSSKTTSRASLEDSLWSPTASSTWSKSYGNTQTTMSTDSLASRLVPGDGVFQQSVGFANALSHAIIREENPHSLEEGDAGDALTLEDETLELAGAPWAKEGIVQHKHHLETTDKKFKDRAWNECFAVVEKGQMRLFSFNSKASSRSQKNKGGGKVVVGGGNWTENASTIGSFTLRQTIANVLPPPGYSKPRPHVFALSLSTGAVHLFHVGTPEIAREFVSTVNYWSARLSKEPLVGGVSNVEYGWGENILSTANMLHNSSSRALTSPIPRSSSAKDSISSPPATSSSNNNNSSAPGSSQPHLPRSSSATAELMAATRPLHSPTPSSFSMHSHRPSLQGSIRSSLETPRAAAAAVSATAPFRSTRLPADRVALAEWTPPQQSLMASNLPEEAQLEALRRYVHSVEEELARHNELRTGVVMAFSPRSVNASRAVGNWEKKSSYLLREIVKFGTYVDVLALAGEERKKLKERDGGISGGGGGGATFVTGDDDALLGAGPGPSTPTIAVHSAYDHGPNFDSDGDGPGVPTAGVGGILNVSNPGGTSGATSKQTPTPSTTAATATAALQAKRPPSGTGATGKVSMAKQTPSPPSPARNMSVQSDESEDADLPEETKEALRGARGAR
ncbi:MAG: hypothetical protein M1831_005293 [Alyxoria varia]|nr:MAG: hypothetical protein M1831_005293 [Alyxoria varia]